MIRAIIFDCFGVLVRSSFRPFFARHLDAEGQKIAKEAMDKANKGLIPDEELMKVFAALAGMTIAETKAELNNNPADLKLFEYIKNELKPKYKIGFLSNAAITRLSELFTPEQLKLFDAIVVSHEVGFAKPEAQAYEITAEKLGCRLEECVFVDDQQDYIDGAKAVGMKTVLFESAKQLKQDLPALLSQ